VSVRKVSLPTAAVLALPPLVAAAQPLSIAPLPSMQEAQLPSKLGSLGSLATNLCLPYVTGKASLAMLAPDIPLTMDAALERDEWVRLRPADRPHIEVLINRPRRTSIVACTVADRSGSSDEYLLDRAIDFSDQRAAAGRTSAPSRTQVDDERCVSFGGTVIGSYTVSREARVLHVSGPDLRRKGRPSRVGQQGCRTIWR